MTQLSEDVTFRIEKFLIQILLADRLTFGTQPRYKAPSDLRVEMSKRSD